MPRPTIYLSNCYTPQPSVAAEQQAAATATRADDRATHSLRQLRIQSSSSSSRSSGASCSCLVELGHTKVLCQVWAPLYANAPQLPPSIALDMEQGTLHCQVQYAAQISYPTAAYGASTASALDGGAQASSSSNNNNRFTSWIMTRETSLSSSLHTALAAAVPLEPYPKACILVQVTVVSDDGSILPTCILASTVALVKARVILLDTVTACTVAVVVVPDDNENKDKDTQEQKQHQSSLQEYWADPTLNESLHAKALVTLGIMPNSKEVTLWEQTGAALSPQETNKAMDLARDGCRTLQRFVREHLLDEFAKENDDS